MVGSHEEFVPSGKKIIPDIISKNLQIFSNPAFRDIYIIIPLAFFTLLINHCCQNDIYQNRHHTVHRIGC